MRRCPVPWDGCGWGGVAQQEDCSAEEVTALGRVLDAPLFSMTAGSVALGSISGGCPEQKFFFKFGGVGGGNRVRVGMAELGWAEWVSWKGAFGTEKIWDPN